jgi:uncharacterized protein with HEPN domain
MKMKDDTVYLRHILDAVAQIEQYLRGVSVDIYADNRMLQDAIVRQLEIIGEASGNLSKAFCNEHPEVPWGQIVAMRNRIAHDYMNVDMDIVWDVVQQDLPLLKGQAERILKASDTATDV